MVVKFFSSLAAGAALLITPIAASAAPVNPAASLSPIAAARASSPSSDKSHLSGGLFSGNGAIFAVLIIAGIAAIIAVGVSRNNDNPRSP